jgi:hypothetical protein
LKTKGVVLSRAANVRLVRIAYGYYRQVLDQEGEVAEETFLLRTQAQAFYACSIPAGPFAQFKHYETCEDCGGAGKLFDVMEAKTGWCGWCGGTGYDRRKPKTASEAGGQASGDGAANRPGDLRLPVER